MALKKYFIIALVVIMAMVLSLGSPIAVADYSPEYSSGLHTGWMMETYDSGTYNRTYEYYIPSGYTGSEEVPLLFSFHGLGSNPEGQINLTNFDVLAEREGFIAVFPKATALDPEEYPACAQYLSGLPGDNIMWNIGMNWTLQYCAGIDDVGFTSNIIDWFEDNYNIDTSRIYATGMSNGAMFSYYVALELPNMFAGIAPVCSPMTLNGFGYADVPPLTVIMMMSPTDPIVDYDGLFGAYGSMNDTVDFWLDVDGITSEPVTTVWSDDAIDPTTVTSYVYSGGTNGTQVIFFKMEGTDGAYNVGHTWPGGPQYTSPLFIGLVSNQIDGSGQIWKYLPPVPKYYLRICSTYEGEINTFGDEHDGGSVTTPGEGSFFYDADISPTVVNLVATPKSTVYEFTGWTGDVDTIDNPDAATTTITINPNTDYEIIATFEEAEEEEPEEPEEPGGCFIATAAYGTSTAEQLVVLREFRDNVLLESTVGSQLVDLYYQLSPPIADFISENSVVRTLVRELLVDPIIWLVEATGDIWRN
jgi:polyhydroxybutyrate depolymerase